jgi:hypothetical protein
MEGFEDFARNGERSLLLRLADFLSETQQVHTDPDTALAVVRNLARTVGAKKKLSVWVCLGRLCDSAVYNNAGRLLDDLQELPECGRIIDSCANCLTHAPRNQRIACLRFLVIFMSHASYRRRMVMATSGLDHVIVAFTKQEMEQSPMNEALYSIIALCNLSLAHVPDEIDCALSFETYGAAFLDLGGLQVMSQGFRSLVRNLHTLSAESPDQLHDYFPDCIDAMRCMWALLSSPWGLGKRAESPGQCGYKKSELVATAGTLVQLLYSIWPGDYRCALLATWSFLLLLEAYADEEQLVTCLSTTLPGYQSILLVWLSERLETAGDQGLSRRVHDKFKIWRRKYHSLAKLVADSHVTPGRNRELENRILRMDHYDPAPPSAHSLAGRTASADENASQLSCRREKDRHCICPDRRWRRCYFEMCALQGSVLLQQSASEDTLVDDAQDGVRECIVVL